MTDKTYSPPKVWTWDQESGGRFANINRAKGAKIITKINEIKMTAHNLLNPTF